MQGRRRTEQADQLTDKLLAILNICRQMNSVRERRALLDLLAREAARLMEADRASIFLLDRDKGELWSTVALGSAEPLRFDARLGIAGAVVATGQMINVTDAQNDSRFYRGIDVQTGYHTRSLLAAPLVNLLRALTRLRVPALPGGGAECTPPRGASGSAGGRGS